MHELLAFDPKLVGLQAKELTSTGVTRLIVAGAELALYVAVTVAVRAILEFTAGLRARS